MNNFINDGRLLPVMEEFYSIQGEGQNTGTAAYFLRIGGCDVGCSWCDVKESWNADIWLPIQTDEVIKRILQCPSRAMVVTEREPLQYNLDYLCNELKKNNIRTFLETSGSFELSGIWDWICLSPKKKSPPLQKIYTKSHELKVIIHEESDFLWAEKNAGMIKKPTLLLLQPEWSERKKIIPLIVEYILKNPQWKISLQSHKYMNIP